MPSQGFYVRHVKGIQFDNIEIQAAKADLRPTFVLDDVSDADFFRIKAPHAAGTIHAAIDRGGGAAVCVAARRQELDTCG